jgi:ABC-type Zn uptake system ZnuABC Zn-binding protein ZnuA
MKKIFCIFVAMLLFASLRTTASVKIVASTPDFASIAKEIGGDLVEVISIARGYEDFHHIMAKPSYILKANRADLWIETGMELEIGWSPLILAGSRNPDILVGSAGYLDCSTHVRKLEIPTVIDRSLGDIHPAGNPHYILDPFNGRLIAGDIAEKLSSLDPSQSAIYEKNLDSFKKRLDEKMFGKALTASTDGDTLWKMSDDGTLDQYCEKNNIQPDGNTWYSRMKPCKGQQYIAYHKHWNYFNNRFGIKTIEYLEPKPGIPPTPSHLMKVMDIIKNNHIKLIVQAVYENPRASEFLNEKTGVRVLILSPAVGGIQKVETYLDLFDHLTEAFSSAYTR